MNSWKQKRSVMRRYNLTAKMYDARYVEEQEAKYKSALKDLILSQNATALDVGCGSGLFISHAADKIAMMVGVDASRELLTLAKERTKEFTNVFLVLADADLLPFREGLFEFIFAFTVLQNMPNPAETLKQILTSSIDDAVFVITGLKSAVSLEIFGALLERAGLQTVSLGSENQLRSYVARCIRRKK